MGPVVVTVVAVAIMLVAATFVVVLRLVATVRQLIAAVEGTWRRLEPIVTELRDNGEIAGLEAEQLQSSLKALGERRDGPR
jgi:predicted PurR-regulated permease PerM